MRKLLLLILFTGSVALQAQSVYAKPKKVNGIYCFILSRPLSDFDYIQSLHFSYPDTCMDPFTKLIYIVTAVKDSVPGANGAVFQSLTFDSVAIIHLK